MAENLIKKMKDAVTIGELEVLLINEIAEIRKLNISIHICKTKRDMVKWEIYKRHNHWIEGDC